VEEGIPFILQTNGLQPSVRPSGAPFLRHATVSFDFNINGTGPLYLLVIWCTIFYRMWPVSDVYVTRNKARLFIIVTAVWYFQFSSNRRILGSHSGDCDELYHLVSNGIRSAEVSRLFGATCGLHLKCRKTNRGIKRSKIRWHSEPSTLKVEASYSSETRVNYQWTTRRYIASDRARIVESTVYKGGEI
jgi:hypothetical protein